MKEKKKKTKHQNKYVTFRAHEPEAQDSKNGSHCIRYNT